MIQPLSPWLSCKLPTLISRGWRGRKPAEAGAAARPRRPWRVPAPFRKEPRGRSILHLDLSRRPPSFCPGYQGRGVLFDPRAGRRWWPKGPPNPRWIPEGEGRAETGTSCSKDSAAAPARGAIGSARLCPAPRPPPLPPGPSGRRGATGRRAAAAEREARPSPSSGCAGGETRALSLWLCLSVCVSLASR